MSTRTGTLLVGGGGFIGTALARQLIQRGVRVHILSPRPPSGLPHSSHFHHQGVQQDSPLVGELLKSCDTIVHLASTTTPGASARLPTREAQENIFPALKFLESLHTRPPTRLLFISSGGTVYGNPDVLPTDEKQALRPRSYHGAGKVALEQFFAAFAVQTGVSFAALRPSNVYGPGQALRTGFGFVRHLLECTRNGQTLRIWGNGETARDFLYIDDLVDACINVHDRTDITGCFNVGSGTATTLNQLIKAVEQVTGQALSVQYGPARDIDVQCIALDTVLLNKASGWTPRVLLHEGLQKTWASLQ